jgi:hypothetical protein
MPNSTDILDQLRREWRRTGTSRAARRSLERLRGDPIAPLPAWVHDLFELVVALEPTGGLERVHRARLVALLLAHADDELVRRCLLQTLLPGIVSVARQLRFGEGISDGPRTFLADALAEAVALLDDWAGERRAYAAPDLLAALRCRLRRRLLADKARRAELTVPPDVRATAPSDGLSTTLALDAARGVTDVDLVYARVVLGHSATELATACNVTTGVLHRRLVTAARPYAAASS